MGTTAEELLRAGGGVLPLVGSRSERNQLHYLARKNRLVRPLPGVFIHPEAVEHLPTLARAAMSAHPNAVIIGGAAAALTYWPELGQRAEMTSGGLTVAVPGKHPDHPPFRFVDRRILGEQVIVIDGIRVTEPALTALDLCTGPIGPEAIDRALQLGAVKVRELTSALELTPNRPGNALRRRLVRDVKTEGCSPLERTGHRYLRGAGIDGWVANRGILVLGRRARPDVRFRARKLVLEFDGFAYHSSRTAFEHDRGRDNLFALAGYLTLHFTDWMLRDSAHFIQQVRRGLRVAPPY